MTLPDYQPIDPNELKTFSIRDRAHKVELQSFAKLTQPGASVKDLLGALPDYLGVKSLRRAVQAIVAARRAQRPVVWALGAHVIKVGCAPLVIDLIQRRLVTALALNGATAIHDLEVSTLGATSEEVAESIQDGSFGMVEETPALFAEACRLAVAERIGLGQALGKLLSALQANHLEHSVLAAAYQAGIPVTVHLAIGTDTVHMHANANGAHLGQATLTDFRLICDVVKDLGSAGHGAAGGVWCNIGSAVILPEVFLKAVAVARNLGAQLDGVTTVNLDMIRHYRPTQNVIGRPVRPGHGLEVIGQHEIMLPIMRQAILEQLAG